MKRFFYSKVKKLTFLLILFSYTFPALAQESTLTTIPDEKVYVRIGAGYNFVPWTDFVFQNSYVNNALTSASSKKFSYGKGLNLECSVGYWLNKVIGLELGFSYLAGGRNKITHFYEYTMSPPAYDVKQVIKEKMNVFRFGPGVIFKAELKHLSPYGRLNIWYGMGKGLWEIDENVFYVNGNRATGQFEWEVKGVRTFGFASAMGIKFHTKDQVSDIFFEFTYVGMGGNYQKASRTVYLINGQNELSTLTTSQKEIVYVDQIDYTKTQKANQPREELKNWREFSSYGFNIGFFLRVK